MQANDENEQASVNCTESAKFGGPTAAAHDLVLEARARSGRYHHQHGLHHPVQLAAQSVAARSGSQLSGHSKHDKDTSRRLNHPEAATAQVELSGQLEAVQAYNRDLQEENKLLGNKLRVEQAAHASTIREYLTQYGRNESLTAHCGHRMQWLPVGCFPLVL